MRVSFYQTANCCDAIFFMLVFAIKNIATLESYKSSQTLVSDSVLIVLSSSSANKKKVEKRESSG